MPSPFFILGTGRCGSTYLYALLEHHPHIALTNEAGIVDFLHVCSRLAALPEFEPADLLIHEPVRLHGMVSAELCEAWSTIFDRFALAALEEFYRRRFAHKPFRRWGDKLPDPQAALAFQAAYPDVRHVVLIRDPRDLLCSYRSFRGRADVLERNPFLERDFPLPDFCGSWSNFYSGAMQYLREPLLLRYEDLVAQPRAQLQRVLDYLGVASDAAHTIQVEQGGLFAEHATSASPTASVGRWQRDLTREEVTGIEQRLGPLMRQHGYELAIGENAP